MREILFRGKSVNDGRWIFGDLSNYGDCKTITTTKDFTIVDSCEVVPETIGQYTGMTDENGKKIFEGDIVKHIQKYEISGEVKSIAVIKWNEAYSCWSVEHTNGRITAFLGTEYHKLEVIGNIHDNPELLK